MLGFDINQLMLELLVMAIPLLLGLSFHEAAHGFVAYMLGDPTAKNAGRLTLNPIRHLDPIGTLVFVLTRMVGWAKPVPVNPNYFKDPRKGMMLVAMAGPGTNFVLAVVFAVLMHAVESTPPISPDTPLYTVLSLVASICFMGVFINLVLGVFNLLPIPPLDGSNIVAGLLPRHLAYRYTAFGKYGIVVLVGLILVGNLLHIPILSTVIFPTVTTLAGLLGVHI